MNHYKETLLTTTSQLFWVQMVQKDQEESINALADFLDSTLLYGNHNALTTDKDTARNYFFIERYAICLLYTSLFRESEKLKAVHF